MTRSRLEYHYHSDCHGRTGRNPALEQVISLALCYTVHILVKRIYIKVVAYPTLRLKLSFIVGTEVLVNGYSFFKEQERICPLNSLPHKKGRKVEVKKESFLGILQIAFCMYVPVWRKHHISLQFHTHCSWHFLRGIYQAGPPPIHSISLMPDESVPY